MIACHLCGAAMRVRQSYSDANARAPGDVVREQIWVCTNKKCGASERVVSVRDGGFKKRYIPNPLEKK